MPRAWALELGLQLVAHNAMHRLVAQLQTMRLTEPLLHFQVPGKPCRSGETCFELLEDRWGQTLLARWGTRLFVRQQGFQAARAIAAEPVAHCGAMERQMRRGLAPGRDRPRLQQYQEVQAGFQLGIALMAQAVLKDIERVGDSR
jgi:hypothetical protein